MFEKSFTLSPLSRNGSHRFFRQNCTAGQMGRGLCLCGCGYLHLSTNWLQGKFYHLVTFPNEEPPSVSPALRSARAVTLPLVIFACKGVILMRGRTSISSLYFTLTWLILRHMILFCSFVVEIGLCMAKCIHCKSQICFKTKMPEEKAIQS